jgi:hypothetical protein
MFVGPIMELTSSWSRHVPGGTLGLASSVLGIGILIFTYIEGRGSWDALYASIITGE